jgi:rfaE bifunctional protein kinase chain/domain
MVSFEKSRLDTIFSGFTGKRVAIVGDLMLDRYFWGSVSRISPEAPVPVVEVEDESTRLGGAANVAANVAALGGVPLMLGVVGADQMGNVLRQLVSDRGFPTAGLVTDATRPTTIKTRVIAHGQHVVRVDREAKDDINSEIQRSMIDAFKKELPSLDGIILEDYNKGVMTKSLIHEIISLALAAGKKVTVDPKDNNFFEYVGVTVFKPNRKESEQALGRKLKDLVEVKAAGMELLNRLRAKNILLTLGEKGMLLIDQDGEAAHVPTMARHVADVSGAGDTVISTLTMAMAAGATVRESAMLANFAGGIVCGEVGIAPIDKKILYETVIETNVGNGGK